MATNHTVGSSNLSGRAIKSKTYPPASLYISAVTVGEIQAGIEITRRQDAAKAKEIEDWLDAVAESYGVLAADAPVLRRWAQLMHGKPDHHLGDALIAATALVRGLTVMTRNVDDFDPFGVPLINPFANTADPGNSG